MPTGVGIYPLCNFLWIGRFGDTKTQPSPEILVSAIGMCYKASSVFIDVAKQCAFRSGSSD